MKHLSGIDSLFLSMDRPDQHLHVACLAIYDPSTAPEGKVRFKSVLKHFAARLNSWKLFRRKLVSAPFGLDRPYWIDEPEIDLEYHVRHIALPRPGDWRQLMIQVARIHSRPLDMTKPLWEAYVIEGLDNIPGVPPGGFALYMKIHHSAIDGEGGAKLIGAIHSLTAAPDAAENDRNATIVADREPTLVELYVRAVGNRAHLVLDASKLLLTLGSRAAIAGKKVIASGRAIETGKTLIAKAIALANKGSASGQGHGGTKPHTRFDDPLSPHRVVDAVGYSLDDCNKIRQFVDRATINDIFMAAAGGALRKYLEAKGELPSKSLSAMVPMTTRGEVKDVEASNQISFTAMPLCSDIADPVERLHAVRRGSGKSKAMSTALGKDLPGKLINILPAAVTELLLTKGLMSLANVTVSNVRGPSVPLYLAGARMELFLPVSAISTGLGLNITGVSYNGMLWVCFVCCRNMMPDPAFFAQCLRDSFDELLTAAAASATPAVAASPTAIGAKPASRQAPKTAASTDPGKVTPMVAKVLRKPRSTSKPLPAQGSTASVATTPKRTLASRPRKAAAKNAPTDVAG